MSTAIKFENVSKRYNLGLTRTSFPSLVGQIVRQLSGNSAAKKTGNDVLWALKEVSFSLDRGQSLALIGSNGAGKSTALKLLANITQPTSGNIIVNGKVSALIELGAGFHPDLTGRENIYLNGSILGLPRQEIDRRFDEIVAFSGLERFIDTPVKRYSSGMTVRLGFSVASYIEPEILLVDEVLAVGDADFKQKSMKRIRSLINNGTSIVFVSHNFYLVQAVCQRAVYLENGNVKFIGDTKDVIEMYESDLHQSRIKQHKLNYDNGQAGSPADLVEITKVEVLDERGDKPEFFYSNAIVQIRVHYIAHRPLGKVHVSTFFIRSDGVTCAMMRTKLDDFELILDEGEGFVSTWVKPIQLVGGSYYVKAGVLDKNDSMSITPNAGRSDWFIVKGRAMSYEESSGVFEANVSWQHKSNK